MPGQRESLDRLGLARAILIAAWIGSATAVLLMLSDSMLRPRLQDATERAFVHTAGISDLSLVPSGRPLRAPEARHGSVDLRFSPDFPRTDPDPAALLLKGR